jgi:hypothetical protein
VSGSYTSQQLYPRGKRPRYPLDRRLGGLQSRSGHYGEENILTLPGLEHRSLGRPARSQALYRLRYPGSTYTRWYQKVIDWRQIVVQHLFGSVQRPCKFCLHCDSLFIVTRKWRWRDVSRLFCQRVFMTLYWIPNFIGTIAQSRVLFLW